MRRHILLQGLPLAGLLLLIGCGLFGDDEEEEQPVDGFFTADLDGEPWGEEGTAIFSCPLDSVLWLKIEGVEVHEQSWPYTEHVGLAVAYEGPGSYTLVEVQRGNEERSLPSGGSYAEMDGDVYIAGYLATDDSSANHLQITRYDSAAGPTENTRQASSENSGLEEAGLMEGTFRTTVAIDPEDAEPEPGEPPRRRSADTLRFTNGRFRVGVLEVNDALAECGPVPGTGQGVQ